jgi:hypothetical protein
VRCAVTRRGPAPFSRRYALEDVTKLADRMRDHRRSPVTAWHARHVIDTMESTYRSAQAGPAQDLTVWSGWGRRQFWSRPPGLSP